MQPVPLVRVIRSGLTESVHVGSVAVVDAEGTPLASVGDVGRVAFARSAMKTLQGAVSITLAGESLPPAEVAVMCGSHNGEPVHLDAVRSLLGRAGLDFGALQNPPTVPLDAVAALAVSETRPEYQNCSGNHAGMLLASVRRGWPLETYREAEHPVQQAVLEAVRRAASAEPDAVGVDGCGIPVHALPLAGFARLFAAMTTPGRIPGADEAVAGMTAEPYLVGGRERMCTAVMEAAPDVIVKVGAEGLVCAGLAGKGIGIAVKVEDGNPRALDPAIIHVLRQLEAIPDDPRLERFARPPILGGGAPVGRLEPVFDLP